MDSIIVKKWASFTDPDAENNVSSEVITVKTDKEKEGQQSDCSHLLGIFFAMLCSLLFSISTLIIKYLSLNTYLVVWRSCVVIAISVIQLVYAVVWENQSFTEDILPVRNKRFMLILMLQTFCSVNSMMFGFYGLQYINFADFIVIATSAPVFVTFIAFLLLREQCGIFPVITAILALTGVTIISKPPLLTGAETIDQNTLIGVGLGFVCMILLALCYVLIRFLPTVHHALINLFFGMGSLLQSLVISVTFEVLEMPKDIEQVVLIILSAVFACFARSCITLALKYEQAGPVALVRTVEVVFAYTLQSAVLQVTPDLFSIVGAIVTLAGVALTAFRKIVSSRPEGDKYRRWFGFLLL